MNFNQDLFELARSYGITPGRIGRYLYGDKLWRKIYKQGKLSARELGVREQIKNAIVILANPKGAK